MSRSMHTSLLLSVLTAGRAAAFSSLRPAPVLARRPGRLASARLAAAQAESSPAELAAKLLELIGPTDRGVDASDALRAEIGGVIEALEASWRGADAFSDAQLPNLQRRAEVIYVGQSSSKKANAAGGQFRGRLGRLLFRTEALFQHVLAPDLAVNVINFKLFGLFDGAAVLAGRWSRPSAARRLELARGAPRPLSVGTVLVEFDAPRVAFGRVSRVACIN